MNVADRPFVVDWPKFSKYFVFEESFKAYVAELRALGRTVTVDTQHYSVIAVVQPLPAAPTCDIRKLRVMPSAAFVKVVA